MPRPEQTDSFTDISKRAQDTLDYIISDVDEKVATRRAAQMPVSKALNDEHVVRFGSDRVRSRVLFLTSDRDALDDSSSIQNQLKDVSVMFAEVHLVVLSYGKKREYPSTRVAPNMWVYSVSFSSTWFLSHVITDFAEAQMQFKDGFRPDVIVALDPFYAGKAAKILSEQYDRPVQIHVLQDFLDAGFIEAQKDNKRKVSLARSVLKRAASVRTNSSLLKDKLKKEFPKIEDLGMLPRHVDSDAVLKAKRSNVLKQKYPQYVFVILTAGVLDQNNTIFRTMDAARPLLFSPKIGMVILGNGPMRAELEKRAEILGIKEQIVFEPDLSLTNDYMLSADMFVCTDTSAVGDEYVIQAAAAGLPIIMAKTPLREDLFVEGESGLLCAADDTVDFTQKMKSVLNTNAFRLQFGTNARLVVKDRLHTDPDMYRTAYRDTIEIVFGNNDLPRGEETVIEAAEQAAGESYGGRTSPADQTATVKAE